MMLHSTSSKHVSPILRGIQLEPSGPGFRHWSHVHLLSAQLLPTIRVEQSMSLSQGSDNVPE